LTASIFQVIIVRSFSLVYFAVFYRLIGNDKYDLGILVMLSLVLMSVGVLSDLGLYYSFMQWNLTKRMSFDELTKVTMGGFWLYILPLALLVNVLIGWLIIGSINLLLGLYLLNVIAYAFFNLVRRYVIAIMKVERTNLLLGSYSVLNSVSVPIFYYYFRTLESVLFAWLLSLIGAIFLTLISLKHIPPVWRVKIDLGLLKLMIAFGFPIFLTNLLRILGSQIDRFMIYIIFDPESLGVYTAMKRIVEILNEAVLVILAGLFPIFSKLFKRDKERGIKIFYAVFRLTFFIAMLAYPFFYINRVLFVHLLIGTAYDAGLRALEILVLGQIIVSLTTVLEHFALGFEKRLRLLIGTVLVIITQVGSIYLLIGIGIMAVPIGFILGKLVFLVYFLLDHDLRPKILNEKIPIFVLWLFLEFAAIFSIIILISSPIIQNILWGIITLLLILLIKPLKRFDVELITGTLPSKIGRFFNVLLFFAK